MRAGSLSRRAATPAMPAASTHRVAVLAATRHSREMASRGYLFHTKHVGVYLHGVTWHVWGENVGETTGSVAHLESAFMHSPVHRANILNTHYRHIGIGVSVSGSRV